MTEPAGPTSGGAETHGHLKTGQRPSRAPARALEIGRRLCGRAADPHRASLLPGTDGRWRKQVVLTLAAAALLSGHTTLALAATLGHDALARDVVRLVNTQRTHRGLRSLVRDLRLEAAASGHSGDMADHGFFSHTGTGNTNVGHRITAAGYSWTGAAENIAAGFTSPHAVMYGTDDLTQLSNFNLSRGGNGHTSWDDVGRGWSDADWNAWNTSSDGSGGWMGSSGHRANILHTALQDVGVGIAYNAASTYRWYWTQAFAVGSSRGVPGNRRSDADADGNNDLVWRHASTGDNAIWLMHGPSVKTAPLISPVPDTGWIIVGTGDFDGDGKADLAWRHTVTGDNALWFMDGTIVKTTHLVTAVPDLDWRIAAVGDYDGDGTSDLAWRHTRIGANAIWLMNGTAVTTSPLIAPVPDNAWHIVGAGDFNADGKDDLLWRHAVTGDNAIWLLDGSKVRASPIISRVPDPGWQIVGTGDFDADGKADVAWRHSPTGLNALWLMDGPVIHTGALVSSVPDPDWRIVAIGDFDGDARADLAWRHAALGANAIWLMDGTTIKAAPLITSVPDLGWAVTTLMGGYESVTRQVVIVSTPEAAAPD